MPSILPRFVGGDAFRMTLLQLEGNLLALLQARQWQQKGGMDAAWAERCRPWLEAVLAQTSLPDEMLDNATMAAHLVDPKIALELSLRRSRRSPDSGPVRYHLARSLFECGALIWSRRLWQELAAAQPDNKDWPVNVAEMDRLLLELPELQRLFAERSGK